MNTEFHVGDSDSFSEEITGEKISDFAITSGDTNPVHLDETYAKTTRFKRCIAHGVLVNVLISRILGTRFPGPGTILLSMNVKYIKPIYPGDVITVKLSIAKIKKDKPILFFRAESINQTGELISKGIIVVLVEL